AAAAQLLEDFVTGRRPHGNRVRRAGGGDDPGGRHGRVAPARRRGRRRGRLEGPAGGRNHVRGSFPRVVTGGGRPVGHGGYLSGAGAEILGAGRRYSTAPIPICRTGRGGGEVRDRPGPPGRPRSAAGPAR